jgi:hypothetical protein
MKIKELVRLAANCLGISDKKVAKDLAMIAQWSGKMREENWKKIAPREK